MSSISGPIDPADLATVSPPFDQTVQGVSPATALVELRGDNGLLLPCTQNPKEAVAGSVTFQSITSLTGNRGAAHVGASVVISAGGGGTPAIGQTSIFASNTGNADGNVSAAITPTGTGTMIIAVGLGPDNDNTTWGVTDTGSHTWTTAAAATRDSGANRYMQAWWTTSTNTSAMTVTLAGTAWYAHGLLLVEVTNLGAFDTGASAGVIYGDPLNVPSLSTAQATEFLLSVGISENGTTTLAAGTDFTALGLAYATGNTTMGAEYRVVTSQGTYNSLWSITGTARNLSILFLAFRGA